MPTKGAVYIVDDDPNVCRSLERVLQSAGFVAVSYTTSLAALEAAPWLAVGCMLLNVRMPEVGGLELQARLNEQGFCLPIVMMTSQGDVETAVQAMKSGAVDFIEKPFGDDRLLSAVETALADAGRATRDRDAIEASRRVSVLSRRERQVLDGVVAGRPNKVIARDLGISVRTVEAHRARMLERLGTQHVAIAIRLAVLARLVPLDRQGGGGVSGSNDES
jgi:two-component system response regulator FixJ